VFTVMDSYPIEWLFPIREGRSAAQLGRKGRDKGRWMLGVRLGWMLDHTGQGVEGYWPPMHVPDKAFNALAATVDDQTITLADLGFRDKDGIPANVKLCPKGTWNERLIVETAFSMLTLVCPTKKCFHRLADYLWSHCAYLAAMFNVLNTLFRQLFPKDERRMSIAEFSL